MWSSQNNNSFSYSNVIHRRSTVRLGEHIISWETQFSIDVEIADAVRHPAFNSTDGHSDIGIIYLVDDVTFTCEFHFLLLILF